MIVFCRISLSKPKQRNLAKNGLVENMETNKKMRINLMLVVMIGCCVEVSLPSLPLTFSHNFYKMFKNRGTSKQRTLTIDLRMIQIISNFGNFNNKKDAAWKLHVSQNIIMIIKEKIVYVFIKEYPSLK